jgi:hypothetical protein
VTDPQGKQRIAQLEQRLADMESRLPAHSIPAAMLIEMEEVEDALEQLRREEHDSERTNTL